MAELHQRVANVEGERDTFQAEAQSLRDAARLLAAASTPAVDGGTVAEMLARNRDTCREA
jgi:hypothetical protein